MLILSRKVGEEIVIGEPGPDQIVITLKKHSLRRVTLGIQSRREIPIARGECLQKPSGDSNIQE